jgi:Rod binding domain-containing protein
MIDNISGSAMAVSTAAGGIPKHDNPAKIHEAAQQFESLLISQLLKTSHDAGGSGWLGTDDDDAGQTGIGFGEEQFARMMASSGGIGLAPMIESGLKAEAGKVADHASN